MAYTTIPKSSSYFDTKLYTQTGSSNNGNTQTITMDNANFVWIKNRSYTNGHCLFDILRGGDKNLATNGTGAQETVGGGLTFGSSDTTIGADTGGYGFNNRTGDNYVAWHWKGGGSGSSNTDGSINTTYTSVDNTAGFSISSYTGTGSNATIGTGLTSKPACVIIKNLTDGGTEWMIGHQGLATNAFSSNKYIHFNPATTSTNSSSWNSTEPTSNGIVSLGTGSYLNGSGKNYICYAFTGIQGYSKFGLYYGNGGNGQPFIYTGFKPAFIITRNVSSAVNWGMFDNKRNEFNVVQNVLLPDNSASETTGTAKYFDFLSNGFKVKNDSLQYNGGNEKHIYMAFGQSIVSTNGDIATAR